MKHLIAPVFFAALTILFLTPVCAASAPLAPWQGEYKDGAFTTLAILNAGKFQMDTTCPFTGDVGIPVRLTGAVTASADGWLHLAVQQKSVACALPERYEYFAMRSGASQFLMANWDLLVMVNALNAYGVHYPAQHAALRKLGPAERALGARQLQFDARTAMPPLYRAMLRTEPLSGAVVRVAKTGSKTINMADPMRPPEMREQHSARVTIDRGTRQGVFVGMRLYHGRGELLIDRVRDNEAEAPNIWVPPGTPIDPGAAVSSRP